MGAEPHDAVPHLTTALTGPLLTLEKRLLERQTTIEQWFHEHWLATPAPFYASVDLRNAGFKLAPVDTNLFPAGFNNLNPAFHPLCVQALQAAVERLCAQACRILLIPENHTRNRFYWENVGALVQLLERAGYRVEIGTLATAGAGEAPPITLANGRILTQKTVQRVADRVVVEGFNPCFILLNNDLSTGPPEILKGAIQPIVPPLALGWWNRLKSDHFTQYRRLTVEFGELTGIDPWFIDPIFRRCGRIDFHKREGEDCLTHNVEEVLQGIRNKYREYAITQKPFVIVKADAGTYGMGIMTVYDAAEVRQLNRKQRNKMAVIKEGQTVQEVMVQEGVYTFETFGADQAVAEPVVYMVDRFVVGGFYRVHTTRGIDENLNAPGMQFRPLAFADSCANPDARFAPDAEPNRFYAYGVIGRLALLAAARELHTAPADRLI
ncbi:MAG: glutamate--cysteine ligase [Acidiferrobacter sp.]